MVRLGKEFINVPISFGIPSSLSINGVLTLAGQEIAPTGTNRLRVGSDFTLNLADSGALYQQIATAAGVLTLNEATGAVTLGNAGTNVFVSNSGTSIFISGSGIAQSVDLTNTGVTLFSRDSAISGAIDTRIQSTGSNLLAILTGLSGQANTNYATVVNLGLTGQQSWSAANNNGINLSGNLTTTGATLFGLISTTTGNLLTSGQSLFNQLTGFSGANNLVLASTGNQAWNAANNNGINLSGNLTQTGVSLFARDGTISGALDTKIALSGQGAWTAANNNGINLSGSLTQTGVSLAATAAATYATLANVTQTGVSLAATAAATYATLTNVTSTGATLFSRDTSISGALQVEIERASAIINVTGNFTVTGNTFNSQVYLWTGTSTWTGTLAGPSSLSGHYMSVKNISTGGYIFLTGVVDYVTNYLISPRSSLNLLSDNTSWLVM